MIKKILVANRGECATRIIRACRELGVATVAVCATADRRAPFALLADESYCLGPAYAGHSYLSIDRLIAIAKRTGSEAIHPGYGFLAENPAFAQACEDSGILFIGPSSQAIAAMGQKVNARRLVEQAGVPIVPGSGAISSYVEAQQEARRIGFPVIVKPSAGSRGIGIRVAEDETRLAEALRMTQSIARSAFGEPIVYLEKYLSRPRHIEFQIIADAHGNIVHLGERECSIQRRRQKLLEEAPSPVVTPELRAEMGAAAIRIARAVGFLNAGTVEFALSGGKFYFLAMNTCLQVGHPVTEELTGIDLVKEQVRITSGEPLSFRQEDVRHMGWAVECRVNAEDPLANFTPSLGRITAYRPSGGIGIRVDSGVGLGQKISPFYDPLLAKLIARGRDREEALQRASRALSEFSIRGMATNLLYLRAVIENNDFRRGDYSTHFLEEHPNLLTEVQKLAG